MVQPTPLFEGGTTSMSSPEMTFEVRSIIHDVIYHGDLQKTRPSSVHQKVSVESRHVTNKCYKSKIHMPNPHKFMKEVVRKSTIGKYG